MSNNYTEEQINSMGITKLKKLVKDEKLEIKGYSTFNKSTKDQLSEKVITKLMIKGRISSTEDEEKFDEEGEYIPPPDEKQDKESREERINRILKESEEKEQIQIDNSLDKYIPPNRKREISTTRVMDSSSPFTGALEVIKNSNPNLSIEDLQKLKKSYDKISALHKKHNGDLGKMASDLAMTSVPELRMLQTVGSQIPYFGIKDEAQYQELKKRMSGQPNKLGGGTEAVFKSIGQLLLNPGSTTRLIGDGISWLGNEVYDVFTKRTKKQREIERKDKLDVSGDEARKLAMERSKAYEENKNKQRKIAEAKGQKLDETISTSTTLRKPSKGDFQVKLTEDATMLDNKKYLEATKKYEEDKRRTLRSKDRPVDKTDFRLRDDLAQYVDSILESHREGVKAGKSSMSDDDIEDLIDISDSLRDRNVEITYRNLAQIKGDIDSNIDKNILNSERVKVKSGAFDYLQDTMLKSKSTGEEDLRITQDKDYQKTVKKREIREEEIQEQKIDDFNREVIESRTQHTSNGYVNTDNFDRPELKARIVYGDTDEQLYKTKEEVRFAKQFTDKMSMYPQLDTQDMKIGNLLFQRNQEDEKRRFSKTFAVPNPKNTGYNINCKRSYNEKMGYKTRYYDTLNKIPDSFIRFSERELIPVFSYDSAKRDYIRQPIRAQAPFTQAQPAENFTLNQKEAERQTNIFPENALRNYGNKPTLRIGKKFNPWVNQNYIS